MIAHICTNLIFILIFFKISNGLFTCLQSAPTIAFVDFCPRNKAEWDRAADRKDCNSMATRQNCTDATKFQYHCLLNHHRNATLEVCAPIFYLQGYCPIYNTGTKEVSENYNPGYECLKFSGTEHCPARYPSSEAYKYQRCYKQDSASSKASECTTRRDLRSEDTYIAVIVMLILLLISTVVALVILIYKTKMFEKFCRKETTTSETADAEKKLLSPDGKEKTDSGAESQNRMKESEKNLQTGMEKNNSKMNSQKDAEKKLLSPDGKEKTDSGAESQNRMKESEKNLQTGMEKNNSKMNSQKGIEMTERETIAHKGMEKNDSEMNSQKGMKESEKSLQTEKPERPPPPTCKTKQQRISEPVLK